MNRSIALRQVCDILSLLTSPEHSLMNIFSVSRRLLKAQATPRQSYRIGGRKHCTHDPSMPTFRAGKHEKHHVFRRACKELCVHVSENIMFTRRDQNISTCARTYTHERYASWFRLAHREAKTTHGKTKDNVILAAQRPTRRHTRTQHQNPLEKWFVMSTQWATEKTLVLRIDWAE